MIYVADRAYLQISQLCKPLCAAFKPTAVGLDSFMHYPMRLDIATLGKSSAAKITRVRSLPSVTAFMSLQRVSLYPSDDIGILQRPLGFLVAKSVVHMSFLCRSTPDSLLARLIFKWPWMALRMVYAQYVLAYESQGGSFE